VKFADGTLTIRAKKSRLRGLRTRAQMRGSICIAGPLLARLRRRDSLPGGCIIGARPINLHLKGFEALGAKIKIEGGYVMRLPRNKWRDDVSRGRAGSTVLGTANVMMAAVMADGVTVIESAACEPGWWIWRFLARWVRDFRRGQSDHHHHWHRKIARRGAGGDSRPD